MDSRRIVGRLTLAAAAVTGVVVGHAATYLLAFRDGPSRQAAVASAGHSHWPEIVVAASALGALAVGIVVVGRLRGSGDRSDLGRPLELAVRLAALQILLFVALEVGERVAAGWSVAELASHSSASILGLGVLVQVAVAVIVATVLRTVGDAAGLVAGTLRDRPALSPEVAPPDRSALVATGGSILWSGAWGLRGPPDS